MPNTTRIEGLLAKVETTYGTDSVPVVGSNAVTVTDRLWGTLTVDYAWENTREAVVTGTIFPPSPGVPRGRHCTLDFGVELKGSRSGGAYAAGNKSEVSDLLRASCWAEATDFTGGAEKLTYTLVGPPHDSVTLYVYAAGWLYKVTGVRGQATWPINPGVPALLRFRMQGLLATDPAATALPGGFVYATPPQLAGVNLALTVGPWTPTGQVRGEFDSGIRIQRLDSGNGTDGIFSFDHGDVVQPLFRLSALAETTLYNPEADKLARTSRALSLQYGTVQYNKVKLTSGLYVNRVRNVNQQGFAGWDLEYLTDSTPTILFN